MPLKSHRILVTGGAGFIGSHLADEMIKDRYEVTVLDDFSTGKTGNIKQAITSPSFRLIRADLRSKPSVKEAVGEAEVVFHLAAQTSVPYSIRHPSITRDTNVTGTMNVLEACLNSQAKQFIFVSTCAVYGEAQHLPISEEHPAHPTSPYAESKLEAEQLCRKFMASHGLKTTILRPFNVYGPRMRKDQYAGVIASFLQRLRNGKPPIIYGDGTQTRDFIHVQDAVHAMKAVIGNDRAGGQTFNVATGAPTTITQLAQLLTELVDDENVKPQHTAARQGDLKQSYADIHKARSLLGFEPKVRLKQGLLSLIE